MADDTKRDFDPIFGRPPCRYQDEECPPECEHGYAGPCVREAASIPTPPST